MEKYKYPRTHLSKSLKFNGLKDPVSLYVHLPFCSSKCPYCDFNSRPSKDPEVLEDYIYSLIDEAKDLYLMKPPIKIETLYFGGGTPSFFGKERLRNIYLKLSEIFDFTCLKESTAEVNPESFGTELAAELKKLGFIRLSIGAQSFIDGELSLLGRKHTAKQSINAFYVARKAGFENIGLDLIYGIPGSGKQELLYNLKKLRELQPESISFYSLTLSRNSPLAEKLRKKGLRVKTEKKYYREYENICKFLKKVGYKHYEVSNWALDGRVCLHNFKYWRRVPYIGLGSGASSFIPPYRFKSNDDPYLYIRNPLGEIYFIEKPGAEESALEEVYLSLRTRDGFPESKLIEFSGKFWNNAVQKVKDLQNRRLLTVSDGKIRITEKGWYVLDRIVLEITS